MKRLVLSSGTVVLSMQALIKTYYYGQNRKQFNFDTLNSDKETNIIKYPTFSSKLLLSLIKNFFLDIMIQYIGDIGIKYYTKYGVLNKDIHILTSSAKILGSELSDETLRLCRTLCAGNGYLHINGFGSKFNDIDIYKTFEGDNTLLRQEIAGYSIELFAKRNNLNGSSFNNLLFLFRRKLQDIRLSLSYIDINNIYDIISMYHNVKNIYV